MMDYKHATIDELMAEISDGGGIDPKALKEIERRLRAADVLCSAVKRYYSPGETAMQYLDVINKAIADYESK